MKDKSKELRYFVEVWVCHDIVDSYKCVSLSEAREWLSKGGWIKSWAYGGCYFEVSKDGKELDSYTLYRNKFYDEEERIKSFEDGELFVYINGDKAEIGKVKQKNNTGDGYFCYYHEGETAADTPLDCMHKLVNSYTIKTTTLGGATEKE